MANRHNITNSALFIPTPSTKIYFLNLYVQIHPKNQQNNITSARIVTKVTLPPSQISICLSCLAYHQADGSYLAEAPLDQAKSGWTTKMDNIAIGGVAYSDDVHWLYDPESKGSCKVYFKTAQSFSTGAAAKRRLWVLSGSRPISTSGIVRNQRKPHLYRHEKFGTYR